MFLVFSNYFKVLILKLILKNKKKILTYILIQKPEPQYQTSRESTHQSYHKKECIKGLNKIQVNKVCDIYAKTSIQCLINWLFFSPLKPCDPSYIKHNNHQEEPTKSLEIETQAIGICNLKHFLRIIPEDMAKSSSFMLAFLVVLLLAASCQSLNQRIYFILCQICSSFTSRVRSIFLI